MTLVPDTCPNSCTVRASLQILDFAEDQPVLTEGKVYHLHVILEVRVCPPTPPPSVCGPVSLNSRLTRDRVVDITHVQQGAFKFQGALIKSIKTVGKDKLVHPFSAKKEDTWAVSNSSLVLKPILQKGTWRLLPPLPLYSEVAIEFFRSYTCPALSRAKDWRQKWLFAGQAGSERITRTAYVTSKNRKGGDAQIHCRRGEYYLTMSSTRTPILSRQLTLTLLAICPLHRGS